MQQLLEVKGKQKLQKLIQLKVAAKQRQTRFAITNKELFLALRLKNFGQLK